MKENFNSQVLWCQPDDPPPTTSGMPTIDRKALHYLVEYTVQ